MPTTKQWSTCHPGDSHYRRRLFFLSTETPPQDQIVRLGMVYPVTLVRRPKREVEWSG